MYNFSDCLIDISLCTDGKRLTEHFTELSVFPDFEKASDNEIKISILLADFDSPFLKMGDNETRVSAIFSFLNLPEDDNYESVVNWQHIKIIQLVSLYLQMQSKHDFARWWTLNRLFYELQRELNQPCQPGEDKDDYFKRKLLIEKNSDDYIEKLKRYEQKLFPDKKMKSAIVTNEMVKIIGYVEKFAQERTAI